MSAHPSPRRLALLLVALSCLLALALRLPGVGTRGLATGEQQALAESQGLDPWAPLPGDAPLEPSAFPRIDRPTAPLFSAGLSLWGRLAGLSEAALRLPSVISGALAAAVVGGVAALLAGPWAGGAAGLLVALSPIHTILSREVSPGAPAVLLVALGLGLSLRVAEEGGTGRAVALGVLLGMLALGPPVPLGLAGLLLAWLATRPGRARDAAKAAAGVVGIVALAGAAGWLRSPLAVEPGLGWVPETTALGVVRCAGASVTRVVGIEYHLVVSRAYTLTPLTLVVVALAGWGATRLDPGRRGLLLAGALLPVATGVALALGSGTVAPLQAHRLTPAVPFLAVLAGVGLAALPRLAARVTAGLVVTWTVVFLALALESEPRPTTPTRALAREVAQCRPPGGTISSQRPLDLYVLAAWRVPGPLWLRTPGGPLPPEPDVRLGPPGPCTTGTGACPGLPPCPGP